MIRFMLNDLAPRHRKVAMNSEQLLHERFPMAEIQVVDGKLGREVGISSGSGSVPIPPVRKP
jgi:hypothetical protein